MPGNKVKQTNNLQQIIYQKVKSKAKGIGKQRMKDKHTNEGLVVCLVKMPG